MPILAGKWHRAELLEAVFDQLSDALFVHDEGLKIVAVNRAAQMLSGMSAEEMVGRHFQDLFVCQGFASSEIPAGTVKLQMINGRERMVVVRTVELLDSMGELEGVVATLKDITEEAEPAKRQIIAESKIMREVLGFACRVALSQATSILIEGESGVGKDVIAKMMHYESLRQSEPFVAINCAAIPGTLLESELFGYEKGAFTDARTQKRGLFELANKGTLFLDEIGEIPISLQTKLLRFFESQSFRRLGGLRDIDVDLRVIAATNKNLREAVYQGTFRQDLYYRLNVIQIQVPSLRERPQDILPLAHFFIQHYNHKLQSHIEGLTAEAEAVLLAHHWPGNVRELRNAVERAMILEESAFISPSNLPITIRTPDAASDTDTTADLVVAAGDEMSLSEQEKRLLVHALAKEGGNQSRAARRLQITRDTMRYKMKTFGLR